MRDWSPNAGHLPQLLHPRDRGVPEDGSTGRYATVLRPVKILPDVAHLLRSRFQHHQEGSTEDGRGRMRLSLNRSPRFEPRNEGGSRFYHRITLRVPIVYLVRNTFRIPVTPSYACIRKEKKRNGFNRVRASIDPSRYPPSRRTPARVTRFSARSQTSLDPVSIRVRHGDRHGVVRLKNDPRVLESGPKAIFYLTTDSTAIRLRMKRNGADAERHRTGRWFVLNDRRF